MGSHRALAYQHRGCGLLAQPLDAHLRLCFEYRFWWLHTLHGAIANVADSLADACYDDDSSAKTIGGQRKVLLTSPGHFGVYLECKELVSLHSGGRSSSGN